MTKPLSERVQTFLEPLKLTGEYSLSERQGEVVCNVITACDHFDGDEAPVCNACTWAAIKQACAEQASLIREQQAEIERLREALTEIEELCDHEIKVRYGSIGEEKAARQKVFHLLVLPRNLARRALSTTEGGKP